MVVFQLTGMTKIPHKFVYFGVLTVSKVTIEMCLTLFSITELKAFSFIVLGSFTIELKALLYCPGIIFNLFM